MIKTFQQLPGITETLKIISVGKDGARIEINLFSPIRNHTLAFRCSLPDEDFDDDDHDDDNDDMMIMNCFAKCLTNERR